jgi:acyl carrier protein
LPGLNQAEIEAKIVGFSARIRSVDPSAISPQDDIYEYVGLDVLDSVELVLEIEDEYGLSVPGEDVEEFTTIPQFAAYFKQRKSAP